MKVGGKEAFWMMEN